MTNIQIIFRALFSMETGLKQLIKIGNNIRKYRNEGGMSQQALADDADIAKSTLQRIEKGQLNPSILVVLKIIHSLEMNLLDIIA